MWRVTFLLVITLASCTAAEGIGNTTTPDYYSPANIRAFADHLFTMADYERAAGEYLRYLHATQEDSFETASIRFLIGRCYQKSGRYDLAETWFAEAANGSNDPLADSARYGIGYLHHSTGHYEISNTYLRQNRTAVSSPSMRLKMDQLRGLNYLAINDWRTAVIIFDSLYQADQNDTVTATYREFAYRGVRLPHRSPWLAAGLSTVLPGSGKMYCDRISDGLVSLLTIGVLAWQAYDGFRDDGSESTRGWVYGSIGSFMYLGNVYGSAVAAQVHNRLAADRLTTRLSAGVGVHFDF